MPDETGDHVSTGSIHLGDVKVLTSSIMEKVGAEVPTDFVQWGDVVSVALVEGSPSVAEVHIDGDPPGQTVTITSIIDGTPYPGLRVAVLFDRPHGAYIIGSVQGGSEVEFGRLEYSLEDWPEAQSWTGDGATDILQLNCVTLESPGMTADPVNYSLIVSRPGVYRYDLLVGFAWENYVTLPTAAVINVNLYNANDSYSVAIDSAIMTSDLPDATGMTLNCHGLCSIPQAGWRIKGEFNHPDDPGTLWADRRTHLDLQYVAPYVETQVCDNRGGG